MDPDTCLARLLDACRDHYRDEAEAAARDLLRWIESGGFLPSDPRRSGSADALKSVVEPMASRLIETPLAKQLIGGDEDRKTALSILIRIAVKRAMSVYAAHRGDAL